MDLCQVLFLAETVDILCSNMIYIYIYICMCSWYKPISVIYGYIQKHLLSLRSIITGIARDSNGYITSDNYHVSLMNILC